MHRDFYFENASIIEEVKLKRNKFESESFENYSKCVTMLTIAAAEQIVRAMAFAVDLKGVVKHLVDGTFNANLCRICLLPLGEVCENIFTLICKEDQEYCIADVLQFICQIKFSESDNYSVCCNCFVMASTAYKFYLLSKRTDEILDFYVEELAKNVYSIDIPECFSNDTLCITLPEFTPSVEDFTYDVSSCLTDNYYVELESCDDKLFCEEKPLVKPPKKKPEPEKLEQAESETEEEHIVVIQENGERSFYKLKGDGGLELVPKMNKEKIPRPRPQKMRRKRGPMDSRKCSRCPVKYRFLGKLKTHMKAEHDIDLFICKICKTAVENEIDFEDHLATHKDIHRCNHCNTIFKKRETIIAHLKWHEEMKNIDTDSTHVCEMCGFILLSEEQLKDHYDKRHEKKFTCFYCGKMYKGELSCEMHIRKHEMHMKKEKRAKPQQSEEKTPKSEPKDGKKRNMCSTCGKDFVDERSLMWHSMLHTNERPHICDVCGRGFISVNRRNQHVLCAHTMPTKRCPLCPALFHLRSMVNSHIKKVHLKAHKRRNRSSKHQNMVVHWRTEKVPIQELGVDIQNDILELQTKQIENDELSQDSDFI